MIALRNEDIVLTRRTVDGRFVIFTCTDVRPIWPLRWWGAVADTGADGYGILARVDAQAAPEGWTAAQLIQVVRKRLSAEAVRRPMPVTRVAAAALNLAGVVRLERAKEAAAKGGLVEFRAGGIPSPYAWTVASQAGFDIPLCPDPESREEGITPEQLLLIIDQLLLDAIAAGLPIPGLRQAQEHVTCALEAEGRRLADIRA
jgi:hypothetical protein